MRGLSNSKKGERVANKRRQQAERIARWIDRFQSSNPGKHLVVLGDFNALVPSDKYVDVIGIIRGDPDNRRPRWNSKDLIQRDLLDLTAQVEPGDRYSYIFRGKKQQLDYILASETLQSAYANTGFSSIDYKFSDHAAVKTEIKLPVFQ